MSRYASYVDFFAQSAMARWRHETRVAGRWPVRLLRMDQDAHEDEDAATDDLVVGLVLAGGAPARWSWGGRGRWNETTARRSGQIGVTPLRTSGHFQTFGPSRMLVVCLPMDGVRLELGDRPLDFGRLHDAYADLPAATRLCTSLWRAAARPGAVGDDAVEASASALVETLLAAGRGPTRPTSMPFSPQEARRIEELVRAGDPRTASVAHLASAAGVPVPVFRKRFRATFGVRPHAYLLDRRLEAGREQLLSREKTIAAVALDLGFADQAHFTTAFQRRFGLSPARYRRAFGRESAYSASSFNEDGDS